MPALTAICWPKLRLSLKPLTSGRCEAAADDRLPAGILAAVLDQQQFIGLADAVEGSGNLLNQPLDQPSAPL